MNTILRFPAIFCIAAMTCTIILYSCSEDEVAPPDLIALQASVDAAKGVSTTTVEGRSDGQYPVGSKATLEAEIAAAQALIEDPGTTQEEADNAKASLDLAVTTYQGLVIKPIAAGNLVAHWSFNEGTGATAGDGSTNKFDGTFKPAPIPWGGGMPEWGPDRNGAPGKAIHFGATGGNVEIPYNTKLNPAAMTISAWLKTDATDANNRFLGLQSWIGYKFQLQETNRPFLTVGQEGPAYDRISQKDLPINEWHHVVATFGGGKTIFYVDGKMVTTWDDTPGEAVSISDKPYNLVIGQDFPTDKYAAGDGTGFDDITSPNYHVFPLVWGGRFRGSVDEMRMYDIALTGEQVAGLYDRERP